MKIFDAIQQITPCPKTKSTGCQCDKLEGITEAEQTIQAIVELEHIVGDIEGFVKLKQKANGPTIIKGILKGLEPGKHGFHIHEFGDLSDGCKSAGGHYNPEGVEHGGLSQGHVGDLGNIVADQSGTARFQIKAERVELSDVVGRAIVIHADEDDLGKGGDEESLKTGNAGDRLACGVIRLREVVEEDYNRSISDKHFDRDQLPQINRTDVENSDFNYKEGKISLSNLKPVQSQRVHGYDKKAEQVFLQDIDKPFIIDKNGYIINGHHRYDAANILGIKRVKAIKIDADIEDVMNHFAHTSSNVEVMDENYFKKLLQEKMLEGDDQYPDITQSKKEEIISEWEWQESLIKIGNGMLIIPAQKQDGTMHRKPDGKGGSIPYDINDILLIDKDYNVLDDHTDIEKLLDNNFGIIQGENFADGKKKGKSRPGSSITLYNVKGEKKVFTVDKVSPNGGMIVSGNGLNRLLVNQTLDAVTFNVRDPNYKIQAPGFQMQGKVVRDMSPADLDNAMMAIRNQIKTTPKNQGVYINLVADFYALKFKKEFDLVNSMQHENFADGKKKGKSRPGRVKRSGASCNGSVTSLRKKAKNSSGEKSKMYHWCANMKSGKKKK